MPPKRARGGDGGGGGAAAQRGGRQGGRGGRDSRRAVPSAREEDDDDDALADSDEEPQGRDGGAGVAEEEEEEDAETAAEKRLRLAKAYLSSLRTELEADRGDDDDDGEDGDGDGGDGRVAARLAADAQVARGDAQRPLGQALRVPSASAPQQGTLWGGHQRPVTAVALSGDDCTAVAASKDGTVLLYDVETAARTRVPQAPPVPTQTGPCAPPRSGAACILAVALSSDGQLLATAGSNKHIQVFDLRDRPGRHVTCFPGHRDTITGLAFRTGTRTLFSCSADRCVKIWSLDDMAYVDTLYGHGAEINAIAAGRRHRALTVGADRTCRLWKVAEDSQLVFHGADSCHSLESCALLNHTEWVTGARDGSLARWTASKKKPAGTWMHAHGPPEGAAAPPVQSGDGGAPNAAARKAGGAGLGAGAAARSVAAARAAAGVPAEPLGDAGMWVNAVAVAPASDLVASGAADGCIRLWRAQPGAFGFTPKGGLPARGFVNGLAVARSGRFLLAAMGQEHRMGRWARDPGARNGVLLHRLELAETAAEEEDQAEELANGQPRAGANGHMRHH